MVVMKVSNIIYALGLRTVHVMCTLVKVIITLNGNTMACTIHKATVSIIVRLDVTPVMYTTCTS